ncbi:MAG: hypothetical protein J6U68_04925 [Clostridia bacterium]|nr:hypothetical protein [Clostridia bacterium]
MKKRVHAFITSFFILSLIFTLFACDKKEQATEIPQCEHSFSEWQIEIDATCEQEGKKQRACSECEFVDVEYLTKLEHSLSVSETVAPTCDKEGYSVFLCECGYTYKSDYKAPTGHTLKKTATVAKTCSEVGYTQYSCEKCEYSFKSDYVPQSHEFEKSLTLPTATQSGFTTYTCKTCTYHYDNDFIKYTDILPSPYLEECAPLCKGLDIYDGDHKQDADGIYLPLDWESIKAQGYDFVILKVGSDYSGKSKTFEMDYEGAKAAGLGVGAYYYAYSSTVSGTRNDAQEVLEWIKGKQFEYPIYYDIEENYLAESLSKDSLTELITVFIEELQANGYYAGLYVNNNWLVNILDTQTILSRFDIWYARYPEVEDPTWNTQKYGKLLSMWQYSDKGIVEGFHTEVDLDYCYRDYPALMKKWGLNGYEKENQPTQ